MKEMIEKLMRDTVKADESMLPHICALDWESDQSSIFTDTDTNMVTLSYKHISHFFTILLIHIVNLLYFQRIGTFWNQKHSCTNSYSNWRSDFLRDLS